VQEDKGNTVRYEPMLTYRPEAQEVRAVPGLFYWTIEKLKSAVRDGQIGTLRNEIKETRRPKGVDVDLSIEGV
jgi:hypothetical protein